MDRAVVFSIVLVAMALIITVVTTVLLFISPRKRAVVDENIVYHDRYVEIYPTHMILNGFYFGPIGRKQIDFDSVSSIEALGLDFWKGRYRIQGTGDFKTWFAHDIRRPSRDRAFIVRRAGKWWRIGFSCEDFDKVAALFEAKGLLH